MKAHTDLVRDVLKYLRLRRIFAWKNNSGKTRYREHATGKTRFVSFGYPGSSDIIGILPGGRFLAVECKTGTGRPTKKQAAFLDAIADAGGVACVARDISDVEGAIC